MAEVNRLSLDTSIVSLGSILGTGGNAQLMQSINARSGAGSYFGSAEDPFRTDYHSFMTNVVAPVQRARLAYENVAKILNRDDSFIPINSVEVLELGIPRCMHGAVLAHPRIYNQLLEDRIQGFGYDPLSLPEPEDNVYARALKSGYVEDVAANMKKNGDLIISSEWCSVDIELERNDVEAIRETYKFIDEFMDNEDTSYLDFTSYPDMHS